MPKPTILAYFPQVGRGIEDKDIRIAYLKKLGEERETVDNIWAMPANAPEKHLVFKKNFYENPTFKQLKKDCDDCMESMVMFQFSGHADPFVFYLGDIALDAKSFATFLCQLAPNLKFVFLNGCSTAASVKGFFDMGILAVVATNYPIYDDAALRFSESFHSYLARNISILSAFENTRNAVRADSGIPSEQFPEGEKKRRKTEQSTSEKNPGPDISAMPFRSSMLADGGEFFDRWGLFLNPDEEKIGEATKFVREKDWWKIPSSKPIKDGVPPPFYLAPKKEFKGLIYPDEVFTIDRKKNADHFIGLYTDLDRTKKRKNQHYVVVGEQAESPRGFTQKLVYEYLLEKRKNAKMLYYVNDPLLNGFKPNFTYLEGFIPDIRDLAMILCHADYPPEFKIETAEDLINSYVKINREVESVIHVITIDLSSLTQARANTIAEFKAVFNKISEAASDTKFYFFWSVFFDKDLIEEELKPDPFKYAYSLMQTSFLSEKYGDPFALLNWVRNDTLAPLPLPHKDDVANWYTRTIGNAFGVNAIPEEIKDKYWRLNGVVDMEALEYILITEIKKLNESHQP